MAPQAAYGIAGRPTTPASISAPSTRIAGYLPTGMVDWPGHITTTLFLCGCSLRCPYCHNPDLIRSNADPGVWERAISHLLSRRGWIDGIVISGGEPTSDPDIMSLLEALVVRGFKIKLDTNGSDPEVLATIVASGLVDHIALDVKTLPSRYDRLSTRCSGSEIVESIGVLLSSGISHEFRTTVYPPLIAPDELAGLAALLVGGDLYVLQQFRPGRSLDERADSVQPASPVALERAAETCSRHLPTITRGV